MMLIKILQPDFVHNDERGNLTQLVRGGYTQINVVTTKDGTFRGGHYHKVSTEAFFVISGGFELTVSKDGADEHYTFSENDMFEIPPCVVHSMNYTQDTILVAMYDIGVEHADGTKDIYAEVV
jgi:mannose-6-phosphate isomerase-like protein (cupin superfamily)